jgi:hypothetical protein
MLCLLAGLLGGVARLGFALPGGLGAAAALHGPLMLAGFLGTVIGLERAVALKSPWAFAAPLLTGGGALALALSAPARPARGLVALGSAATLAALSTLLARHPSRWTAVQWGGSVCFALGSGLWVRDGALSLALPWWQSFLVLTIAGERLELSRLLAPSARALALFMALAALLPVSAALSAANPALGERVAGLAWIGLAAWLARRDPARLSARRPGLPRFMAGALLAGYVWLAAAGAIAAASPASAGLARDAALHALLLGFVFSMIMGHAPVIFPAVLGLAMRFSRRFWAHLALLHASVALRVGADLAGSAAGRTWGGLLGVAAVLLFLVQTATSLRARPATSSVDRDPARP